MTPSPLVRLGSVSFDADSGQFTAPEAGLHSVFYPCSVAVIGATEREKSVGRTTMQNLIDGNVGNFKIYPVNPKSETILGLKAYKSIEEIPTAVDCAVIILPSKAVLGVTEECGKARCKSLIVITAGFKEVGPEGAKLEDDVIAMARSYNMRVIGPNCLGLMMPNYGLNATFAARMGLKGSLAFVSQSGAMCTAALDWSIRKNVGFSSFMSIGSMADVEWADIIQYLGEDRQTSAILIYMETIGNARAFLSAARKVSPYKPIVVIKAGKSEAAAMAAASHTGSLAGSHASYLAAMRRCGVLCVDTIRELFDVSNVIDKQPRPQGNRLVIVTNAGGPGVLATDATATNGGVIADLSPETIKALDAFLPSAWSHANPVDVLGDANAEIYRRSMDVCLEDPNADGVLVVLSPQSVTEPMETAKAVVGALTRLKAEGKHTKPIICSWMGGVDVEDAFNYLNANGVPCIASPDDAAKTFCQLYEQFRYTCLAEEPAADLQKIKAAVGDGGQEAMAVLERCYNGGVEILSEHDSKKVLKSFGIPIAESIVATTAEDAGNATDSTGFPAVVKLHSETITHKSDVGGVKLNVKTKEDVVKCFDEIRENVKKHTGSYNGFEGVSVQPMLDIDSGIELLAGSVIDPQFGPLVVFGAGGCMVEIYQDTCTAIPPLSYDAAKECIADTKISKALIGVGSARFPGVDMDKVTNTLITFSNLVAKVGKYVLEIEINPLLALKDRCVALDARVVLRNPSTEIPVLCPIIRPYPDEYIKEFDGYTMRLLKASDSTSWLEFLASFSDEAISHWKLHETKDGAARKIRDFVDYDYESTFALATFKGDAIQAIFRAVRLPQDTTVAQAFLLSGDKLIENKVACQNMVSFMTEICLSEGVQKLRYLVSGTDQPETAILKASGFGNPEKIADTLYCLTCNLK